MKIKILPLLLLSTLMTFPLVKADDQVTTPIVSGVTSSSGIVFNDQSEYFVSVESARVRATPSLTGNILGELSQNDRVRIINPSVIYDNKYVEISITFTEENIPKSEKYFMSKDYLAEKIVDYKEFVGKYFVVVNVATETLRLYERVCLDNSCPHKMILETEVVVGEDVDHPKEAKGKGRSILGSFRITSWKKFYQDGDKHYPSWYNADYPETPGPDAKWLEWFSKKVMPLDENGKHHGVMRGAFGWYTAMVGPQPFGQWLHGTVGWGSTKDTFIKKVKEPLINIVSNPRSSGCTRNNNEAIAFLRKMIDVGAPIIKIYAKEALLDHSLRNYPNQTADWNYVMTKSKDHAVDREEVLKLLNISSQDLDSFVEAKKNNGEQLLELNSPLNQVIETGTYVHDIHPDVIKYTPGEEMGRFKRKLGLSGNVYGIENKNMRGVFFVDAGVLRWYQHPAVVLEKSGFSDETTPPWMMYSNLK